MASSSLLAVPTKPQRQLTATRAPHARLRHQQMLSEAQMGGMEEMQYFYDDCLEELYPPGSCGTFCNEHTCAAAPPPEVHFFPADYRLANYARVHRWCADTTATWMRSSRHAATNRARTVAPTRMSRLHARLDVPSCSRCGFEPSFDAFLSADLT